MKFGENLKRLIQKRGFALREVSEATGIPESTLHDWTLGKKAEIRDELSTLADFLSVSLDELFTGIKPEERIIEGIINKSTEQFVSIHSGIYRVNVEKLISSKEEKTKSRKARRPE